MKTPTLHGTTFIHPSAQVIGDVGLGEHTSVWAGAVLRGDVSHIRVGRYTTIQDLSLCHVDEDAPCVIGDYVVCGHQTALHGCTVGDEALIGIGATILSHAEIRPRVLVGAHSLVPEGKVLEEGFVYYGSPAKRIRPLTDEEKADIRRRAEDYARVATEHARGEYGVYYSRKSSAGGDQKVLPR